MFMPQTQDEIFLFLGTEPFDSTVVPHPGPTITFLPKNTQGAQRP